MSTETSNTPGAGHRAAFPDGLRLGAVDLTVTDLARSIALLRGRRRPRRPASRSTASASLGAGGEPLVVLHEDRDGAARRAPRRPLPLRAASPHAGRPRTRRAAHRRRGRAARRRVGPRRLRGALPARPRRQRDRDLRRPRPLAVAAADRTRPEDRDVHDPARPARPRRYGRGSRAAGARGRRPRDGPRPPARRRHRARRWRSTERSASSRWPRSPARRSSPPAATTTTSASTPGRARASARRRPARSGCGAGRSSCRRPRTSRRPPRGCAMRGVEVREEGGAIVARDPWETELVVRARTRWHAAQSQRARLNSA